MWEDHPTIARVCGCIAELNLQSGIVLMAAGLHLLQRYLVLESVRVDLVQEVVQKS